MKKTVTSLKTVFALCVCVFAAAASLAANGVWNGTVDALWANSANWSASPYPVGNDTASFTNAGNGLTTIDIAGLVGIKTIAFDSPSVAAYTNGTGAPNSQTLVMLEGGEIKLTDTAANSQLFNCGLQLGATITGGTYTLTNGNLGQTLIFNNVFAPAGGATAGAKILAINGAGNTTILGNISKGGATSLTLTHNSSGTLFLSGSNVVTTLDMNGGTNSVIDIGNGALYLSNAGGRVLNCNQGGVIKGTGKIRLSTSQGFNSPGYDYADLNVAAGKTLVINPEITGPGGLESNAGSGTFVLNGTNTFEGHVTLSTASPISVFRVGNRGSIDSNLGKGTNIVFGGTSKLIYTGTGETSDRQIILNNNGTIDQSGPSGKLSFSVSPSLLSSRTLILQGLTAGVGEFTAPLVNSGANVLSVTKAGAGTWILSGTNTYTGATTVNGGKLFVKSPGTSSGSAVTVANGAILAGNSTISGNVALNAGGMLAPGDVGAVGTLNLGGTLGLTSNTLLFDVSNVATDKVSVVGALTVTGTNTIVLSFLDGFLPAGTNTLMTFASRTGAGTFVLSPAYANASLFTNATSVQLVVTDTGTYSKIWKGNISGNWDTTDANWTNGSEAVSFGAGDAVQFDDTASIFNVGGSSSVLPSSVLFNNSINSYVLSVAMEGTGVVFKTGSGSVTLSGANTFTGPTTIASGMLTIGETGVLGGGNYATNIINNGALNYASSIAQTNSGVISGGGYLTSSGSGTLTLLGANTYIGPTTVNAGVLKIQNAACLGSNAEGTLVTAGATLELAGNVVTATEALSLFGTLSSQAGSNTYAGAVTLQQGATFDVATGSFLILTESIAGVVTAPFTKIGGGTLRLTKDPNNYGPLTINEGVAEITAGTTDGNIVINSGAMFLETSANAVNDANTVTVNAGGTYDLRGTDTISALSGAGTVTMGTTGSATLTMGNALDQTFSGVITNGLGTLSLTKNNAGALTLSGLNTYNGTTTMNGGRLNINNGGSGGASSAIGRGTFTINGYTLDNTSGADITLSPNNVQNWNGDFTFIGSKSLNFGTGAVTLGGNRTVTVLTNTLTVGGVISGAFSLTKNGAGILTLSGANAYSGATTVNGGILLINGSTVAASGVTVNSGAILGGSGTINGTVNVAAGGIVAPGGVNATNTLTLTNAGNALTLNGNTLLFDLPSSGTACDKINITSGTGKLVLNGVNKIALSFPYGAVPAGDYILMTCTGGITTNSGVGLTLLSDYPGASLATVGNNVVLTLGNEISGVTWKGNVSGVWDNDSLNWTTNGIDATSYAAGNVVTFDDTATGNFIVSSGGTVTPASVLFNNSVNDYFISADLSGTGPLVKLGSDTAMLLTGVSTYNPVSITVNDGTMALGGASQLNSGFYAGNIINNATFNYASSAMQTNSGIISGAGTLTVSGSGMLALSGTNTYTGPTFVDAGVLTVQHANALGTTAAGTTVASGAKLEIEGNITTLGEALTLNGTLSSQNGTNIYGGTVTLVAGTSINVGTGSMLTLNAFQANGAYSKDGAGWLKLLVDPNGLGVMTINNGVTELAQATGSTESDTVINNGASLIASVVNAINDANSVIVNAGGSYVLRLSDTINIFSGAGTLTKDNIGSATLYVGNSNGSGIFSGVIENGAGAMSFEKKGSGIQILSGTNTYTGTTLVSGGTLLVNSPGSLSNSAVTVNAFCTLGGNGSINGTVNVTPNGYLAPGGMYTSGTLTLGQTLTLNGNTLFFDVSSAATDQLVVTGVLTINGVNTIALSFPDGALPAGDYTLMTFAPKAGTGSFALLGNYPNTSLLFIGNSLVLRVSSGSISGLTWNGNESVFWDMGLNWKLGSTATNFAAGDVVTFDDTASSFSVISDGVVTPSSVFFNIVDNPFFVAANIDGTAPLLKIGAGTATLSALSTYNPTSITVNTGTLILGGASQLNSGNCSVPIAINSGSFNHSSSATQTLSGVISGGGNVTKAVAGNLTFSSANTYSGGTTVSGGTLYGANASAFGTAARTLTLSGGTLDLALDTLFNAHPTTVSASSTIQSDRATSGVGITHALGTLSIGNSTLNVRNGPKVSANSPYGLTFGTVTMSAATPTFDVGNNGTGLGTLTLGALNGNFNFIKANSGTLYLGTTTARAGGAATITLGTLKLGHVSALGTLASTLTLNGGILDLATDTPVNAYTTTVSATSTILSDRATSGAGSTHTLGTLSIGNQTLNVRSGLNVITNSPYGLAFGAVTISGATPTFDVGNNGTGLGTLTLGALGGNFNFNKANSGTLFLGTTTARGGGVATITGGTLKLGNTSALGTVASTLALNGGILDLATDTTVNAHPTTVGGNSTIQSDKATANSAGITHTLGTLSIAAYTLYTTAGANVNTNASYGLTFGNVTMTGNATFDVANSGTGLGTLTLGAVGGAFNLTKAGAGTLILPATNTYTGTTTVNGGTLLVNGIIANGAVSVANAALLAGSGTITGAVNVVAGGMLAPGGLNATNTLTLANTGNALTLNGNTLFFDLPASAGGACDKINITAATGKLVWNGANKIALSFPYGPTPAGTYTLMTCTGGITTNTAATLTLLVPYSNATLSVVGNNVVLTTTSTLGLTWKGYLSDVWDNGILNWTNATAAASFATNDAVMFDDTAVKFAVSSVNPVSPSSVSFNNSVSNYTVSASMGGTGPLMKFGSGTVTLSGTNNLTGGTTVNVGTLVLTGTNTGGTATTTIYGSGMLQIGAGGTSGTLLGSGNVSVWANNGLQFNRTDPVSSPVVVNNSIGKSAGTYSMVVNSGAVQLGGAADNGANAADVKNGATLILAKPSTTGWHALGNNSLVEAGGTMMLGGTGNYQIYYGVTVTVNSGGVIDLNSRNQDFTGGAGKIILSGTGISGNGALINSTTSALSTLVCGSAGLTLADNSSIGGAGNIAIFGLINGTGFGITKVGSGSLTLVSTNTYNGTTLISNGRLVGVTGGSCASSALIVQSSGTGAKAILGVSATDNTKQWTCASLTTAAGVLSGNTPGLEFVYYTAPSISVAPLNVMGNVTLHVDTTISVNPANLVAGDYPLLVASGTVPATTPVVTIGGGLTGTVAWGKSPYSAQTLVLTVTGSSASKNPLWLNYPAAIWDVNNAANLVWKDNTGAVTNYQESVIGDSVVFDDRVATDTFVTLNSGVTPMSMIVSNSTYSYTMSGSGAIAGLTGLTKDGNNMLTLSTFNTYIGPTTVSAGTLSVGVDNNLGAVPLSATPASIVLGGGTLRTTAGFTLAANRGITLTGNSAIDTVSGTLTYSGIINGADLSLTKNGAGTLQLTTASNVYSGGTFINAGAIQLGNNGNENVNALGTGTITLNTNALLSLYCQSTGNTYSFTNSFVLNGGIIRGEDGNQRLATGGSATFIVGAAGGTVQAKWSTKDVYIDGILTGSGPLTLSHPGGTGTQPSAIHITKADNPYLGIVSVSGANNLITLSLDHATALQSATVNLNPGTAGALLLNTGVGNTAIIAGLTGTGGSVKPNTAAGTYTLNVNNTSDFSYGGTFVNNTGVLALQKTGTGSLTLSGASTHTGATTINKGRLAGVVGGSCASSAVTVAATTDNSATFEVSITDNTKQWTCSSLTINNAGISSGLDFNFGSTVVPSATAVPLKVTTAATFTTPTVITIKAGNLPVSTGNGYPLMTWGTGPTDLTGITLALPSHITGNLAIIGTTNYLQITSNTQPLIWAKSGAGDWSTNAVDTNWKDRLGTITAYGETTLPGDNVVFSDSNLVSNATVTLNSIVTPASMMVSNVLYTYEISGNGGIAGSIGVTKSGTNRLILGTANTYAGVTDLKDGILKLGNTLALPTGNILSMAGTATLDLNGYGPTLANISASAAANTIIDNSAGVGKTTLSILNQSATPVSAIIKDGASKAVAVSLININSSNASFPTTAANTFSGGLLLKNGSSIGLGTRLRISALVTTVGTPGNITSSPFGKGPITIGEAATDKAQILLDTVANITVVNDIVINTSLGTDLLFALRADLAGHTLSGKITANSDLSFGTGNAGFLTINNEISGVGGVTVASGTLTLSGPNIYTGKTIVNGGTLIFNTLRNVGAGTSALGAPTTVANGTIDINAVMQYSGATTTSDRILKLTGGSGSLHNTGTGVLTLTGGLTGLNVSFMFRGAGTIVESGLINIGSGVITHTDIGTLILTNPLNPFSGQVVVADGVISVDTIADSGLLSPLGTGNTIQLGQNSGTIGKLQFTGPTGGAFNRSFFVSGNTVTGGGIIENTVAGKTLTLNGNIYLGANGPAPRLQLAGAGDGVVNGTINNTLSILKGGLGTWTLMSANTYTGATTVAGGKLSLSGMNGSIAGSLVYTITAGGTLLLDNTSTVNNTNRLSDTSAINLDYGTLCFTNNGGAASYYENAGALFVTNSGGTIFSAQAAVGMTNSLSFGRMTRTGYATLNFTGEGLGESDQNRIFIANQPNGLIGLWATINTTNFAAYDSNRGVIVADAGAFTNIYAMGPSIIPNDPTLNAGINELGTGGGITLEAAVTNRIKTLVQNTDWQATTVAMPDQTLLVNEVGVSAGNARALTLGTVVNEGAIAPLSAGGELLLTATATNSVLTVNAAVSNNTTASSVSKMGPGTVVLAGRNTFTGALTVKDGALVLSNTSANAIDAITVKGSSVLSVNGPTSLGTKTLTVGNESGERGSVVISTDATMGKLLAGYTSLGAAGSVIQDGGTVLVGTNSAGADILSLGTFGGYGYYRKNAGSLSTGQLALTGNSNNSNNYGVFDLFSGTVDVVPTGGWLIFGWGAGNGVFNLFGGSLYSPPNNNATMAFAANRNSSGMLNLLGSGALLDVTGKGTARWFDLAAQAGNKASVFNLNAGVCLANRVGATVTTTPTYVNFNGGTLRANVASTIFLQGFTASTIYPSGAIIDSTNVNITVAQSLLAPTDYGVVSVDIMSHGAGYIGAPVVMISGGSGTNATAIARVDLNPASEFFGQVTSIEVTSPGVSYQLGDVLTVTCLGGGYTSLASATVTLGANSKSGGLTKLGSGTMTISGTNTYGGATTISSGTLRLGVANALPTNSVVNVDGGIYDLNGFAVTNGAVNVTSGSIINGRLNSAGIIKDGDGTALFTAMQTAPAPIVINGGTLKLIGGIGLYEGRVSGAFDLTTLNPKTAIQLCPTNAYRPVVNSDGVIWVDNSTYIYNGYIWNSSTTNETWTFCKSFDDSVLIMVDGTVLINNGTWNLVQTANYVMTPGPHTFEVRLGQGSGGVGQVVAAGSGPGVGFDRLGRSSAPLCVPIIDPGDGSMFTLGGRFADASTVELAANSLLDLGGTAQNLAGLSGSGTVSNGTLSITGTISPAGTNVIGALTVKAATTFSGNFIVDLATDGTSDRLVVDGNLDLSSSPTLEIVNLLGLNTSKMYTLITYSGTLSGSLTLPGSLNNTLWALRTTPDGTNMKMQLFYRGGTLIRVM